MPDYAKYKDDEVGAWYTPHCDPDNWPDPKDDAGFNKYMYQYYADHSYANTYVKYFPAVPPLAAAEVPPEFLREIAIKNLRLPDPELDWNPKLKGSDATLVNFETWFWLNNAPPQTLSVRAEALGNWASVTAMYGGMDITAPGEEPQHCTRSGIPYTTGAHTDCSLVFSRSSVAVGAEKTPVTVKTNWTATWTAEGRTPEPIMFATDPSAEVPIRVDEVQTLVTGTG